MRRSRVLVLALGFSVLCLGMAPPAAEAGPFRRKERREERREQRKQEGTQGVLPGSAGEALKTVMIRGSGDTQGTVWIRLTPDQYRSGKVRAKVKRVGVVRVVLRPRQLKALSDALSEAGQQVGIPEKFALRVDARRMRRLKGLKGRYVVRRLDRFVASLGRGEESDEDASFAVPEDPESELVGEDEDSEEGPEPGYSEDEYEE